MRRQRARGLMERTLERGDVCQRIVAAASRLRSHVGEDEEIVRPPRGTDSSDEAVHVIRTGDRSSAKFTRRPETDACGRRCRPWRSLRWSAPVLGARRCGARRRPRRRTRACSAPPGGAPPVRDTARRPRRVHRRIAPRHDLDGMHDRAGAARTGSSDLHRQAARLGTHATPITLRPSARSRRTASVGKTADPDAFGNAVRRQ